ncbi:hypothetical protein FNV43_RR27102 [Rhamnella rubrinervis]|uniref:TIR domain-containing protein n=1 Tax=Rhamnella rubrinervis TaxID=2594499 RepID=A0A8K0DJT3_9ROSA|nr:hypothetical protein FNV43_RR27102 [Rhamnella rubrinervis]
MATITSPNSSPTSWKYDVFLSFRGEDTRKQVTDHLYYALNQKGINTFRDDKELKRGKPISPELLKAVEESRFAVVILSKDYASSSWCLDELSKIVECNKVKGQTIIPVFYHVEPTEAEAIQEIVREILKDLNQTISIGNNELVGRDSRTKKMDLLLDIDLNDIRTIGVWGMGGIGKTTVAREVFRKINANFDASFFIDNVREESAEKGILHLQNLLYKNLVDDEGNIYNYDMGVNALRRRLNSKRVLIILDDVDCLEQTEALVGSAKHQQDWLGPGSRVIVTTRDKHLLKTYGEEYMYEVEKLNHDESLELLCQKAFKGDHIGDEFIELLMELVEYADGYPLALKVLGSFLFGRSIEEWLDTLAKLKKYPDKDILHMLRMSLNGLDDNEKNIFLDIACFFRGEYEYRVKKILDGCGFYPEIGIKVLIEKSLITMLGDKLWMHDLLHKLGRDVVHQESPEEPGRRSRVWSREDARHILVTDTIRLEKLILINLTNCKYPKRTPDFSMVPNLERLILEDCKGLLEVHPTIGVLKRLVLLNLKGCESLNSLPQGICLKSLKTFILSGCTKLDKFPEIVGNMDNLTELYLDTTAIKELPTSIKRLTGLVLVNVRDCKNLLSLPNEICSLTSLKTLDVSGCSHLKELPENLGSLEQFVELHANRTAIIKAPSLKNLKKLCFAECSRVAQSSWQSVICGCFWPKEECISFQSSISLSGFSSLTSLNLRNCNLSEGTILEDIGSLSSLQILDLSENSFTSLPEIISQLVNLRELSLNKCRSLDLFPRLPLSVRSVNARDCPRLSYSRYRVILWTSKNGFTAVDGTISDVDAKSNIIIYDDFDYMFDEHFDSNDHFDSNFYAHYQDQIYCGKTLASVLGRNSFPEWCSQRRIASCVWIQLPVENSCETCIGLFLFVDFLTQENADFDGGLDLKETFFFMYFPRPLFAELLKNANRIAASVWTERSDMMVKMCGMHLLFNQDVPEFCSRLVQILGKKLNWRSNIKHFKEMLKEECTLEVLTDSQKRRNRSSNSTSSGSLQQRCTSAIDSDTTSQLRRKLYRLIMPLITVLIHGSYARNYCLTFSFPSKAILIWFSALTQLNQCHAVEAYLWTMMTPDVEVQMCGIQIAYEQDGADVVEMITDIALSGINEDSPLFCIQVGRDFVQVFSTSVDEHGDHQLGCLIRDFTSCYFPAREYETSVKDVLALSNEEAKSFVPSHPTANAMVAKGTSKDSKFDSTILKIMAEDAPYGIDSEKWQKEIEELLKSLFGYDVVITLILRGHVLSVLSPFNAFSSYDFYFPRYTILDWFQDYQGVIAQNVGARLLYQQDVGEFGQSITRCVTSLFDILYLLYQFMVNEKENPVHADDTKTSTNGDSYGVAPQEKLIQPSYTGKFEQLPPNVHSDRNWVGLTLCAYFSDPGHPITVYDNFDLDVPHNLVCFLDAEKVDQLNHCTHIKASFASDRCLRVQKCGLRFLYWYDEENFIYTIDEIENERSKKQYRDGHEAIGCTSYTNDHGQESMQEHENLNPKDKGKRLLQ